MVRFERFRDILRETGEYHTPAEEARPRLPPLLATPLFTLGLGKIHVRSWWETLGKGGRDYYGERWAHSSWRVLHLCEQYGGHIHVAGFQGRIRTKTPVVYVANHASQLETYLLPCILLSIGGLAVIVKSEIARMPFFGAVARASRCILVERTNPLADLRKVLEDGGRAIQGEERSVLIFPQSKRHTLFDGDTFNSLGAKLAQRAGVPMVPVAVKTDFMPLGRVWKDISPIYPARPIRVECGPSIPSISDTKTMTAQAVDFIAGKLDDWEKGDGARLLGRKGTAGR